MKQYLITEEQLANLLNECWHISDCRGAGLPVPGYVEFYRDNVLTFLNKLPQIE